MFKIELLRNVCWKSIQVWFIFSRKKNSHYEDLKPTRTNMGNELKAINTNAQ